MYTLDTNILIYYSKGIPEVVSFLEDLVYQNTPVFISTYTEVELFSYSNLNISEAQRIESMLRAFTIISLDSKLARMAAFCRRNFKIKAGDSIIAATALDTRTILVTRNVRDFKNIPNL